MGARPRVCASVRFGVGVLATLPHGTVPRNSARAAGALLGSRRSERRPSCASLNRNGRKQVRRGARRPVRRTALVLVVATALAACGDGSSNQPTAQPPSAAEQAYLTKMRALCARAAPAAGDYRRFASAVEQLKPPARFASDH